MTVRVCLKLIVCSVCIGFFSACTPLEELHSPVLSKYSLAERADYLVSDLLVSYSTYDFKSLATIISPQCIPAKKQLLRTIKKQKVNGEPFRMKYSIDKVETENGALHVFVTWEKQFEQSTSMGRYLTGAAECVFMQDVLAYRLVRVHGESPFVSANVLE